MAQSRPPPVRTQTTGASSPPLSPRTQEKGAKHHTRRKSGKDHVVSSERKPSRPATLNRRQTPQYINKSSASSSGRRDREREHDEEERSRDSGESFPQYCMSCEKQFLPANNTFLYCSDSCRAHDQVPTPTTYSHHHSPTTPSFPPQYTPSFASYSGPSHSHSHEEGPDIIPRFSPTQSRPRSYFNSDPYPATYQTPQPHHSHSPSSDSSTALASLRDLATALPRTYNHRPDSPPLTRPTSGVWNYIPFAGSKSAAPTPGNSYGAEAQDMFAYGKSHGAGTSTYYAAPGLGMDRPLPPRGGPGGYGHRPRSIDLVTPFTEN